MSDPSGFTIVTVNAPTVTETLAILVTSEMDAQQGRAMTTAMDKHQRRANRILRNFGHYVDEAAAQSSLDTPTIARTKPKAWARLRQKVARRLFAKGKVGK